MMLLPMQNHHYGFKHKQSDFQGRMHPGYDYNGPGGGHADKGMELAAIAPGRVSFIALGHNKGWGNVVIHEIDMEQFFIGYEVEKPEWCPDTIWVKYAHCDEVRVKRGESVKAGEVIATLGGSGGWSSHLHWDMKQVANGPLYYPPKGISEAEFDRIYLDPEAFIASINAYITEQKEAGNLPTSDLIKSKRDPEVYYYNGKQKFHIPDWQTLVALFGDSPEIEEIQKTTLKQIEDGDPFPSLAL